MTPSSPPSSPSWSRLLRRVLAIGLAFALVGLLLGLRTAAITTLPHILQPGPELNIQEVEDGLPVPRLLNWDLNQIEGLMALRDLRGPLLFGAAALLFSMAGLLTISTLDRTFQLFSHAASLRKEESTPIPPVSPAADTGEPISEATTSVSAVPPLTAKAKPRSEASERFAGSLDTVQLGRVLLRLLAVGIPYGVVWLGTGLLAPEPIVTGLRCIGLGLALWLGFRREEDPEASQPPWSRLALQGALFGVGLFALSRCAMPAPSNALLARFHALGPFRRDSWNLLVSRLLFSQSLVWFGVGALLVSLGRSGLRTGQRVGLLILPLAAGALALLAQQPFSKAAMSARYDTTDAVLNIATPYDPTKPTSGVPTSPRAGQELAQRTGLTMGAQPASPDRSLVLFHPQGLYTARIAGYTENGLTSTQESASVALDYLKRHNYQTALSWVAAKHIYDVGSTHLDQTAGLSACLLDFEQCPHPRQLTDAVQSMLFTCAASPENLALLDRWADETRFAHPDRESKVLMGRMYERVGEIEKALIWYKKAEMPRSFMARVRTTEPNFHSGVVTGVLRLNGRPLAGIRVGALPIALKAEPRFTNEAISGLPFRGRIKPGTGSINDILSGPEGYYHDDDFPAYHPRPHALRWICAGTATDANGAFTLNYLTAGEYLLVCTLPPDMKPTPPSDSALHADNAPPLLVLDTDKPKVNLGAISLSYH